MIQMFMAQAILAGLVTKDEADNVVKRIGLGTPMPTWPSEVYDRIMQEIEREKADRAAFKALLG